EDVAREKVEEVAPPVIVHTLDEEFMEQPKGKVADENLSTPPSARNMDVTYEVVDYEKEDFIITDTSEEVRNLEVIESQEVAIEKEEQFMFTFDFPIQKKTEEKRQVENTPPAPKQVQQAPQAQNQRVVHDLNERTREIEVKEHIEIIPVTESSASGIKRYSLDDYMEVEQMLKSSKPAPKKVVEEDEVIFEKKTVAPAPTDNPSRDNNDPFDNPISESLIERAAERRSKMKEFNYKFRNNNAQLEEIERQPA